MALPAIISLTTDFGLQDPYVGQLKGAILRHNPRLQLIDLTHAIAPGDIATAARTIAASYHYFPAHTVHLSIIDPGVGSSRAILVAQGEDHFFIAPDNGTLSLLLRHKRLHTIHRLKNGALQTAQISATFHGRDLIAPLAAQVAGGLPLSEVGPRLEPGACCCLSLPTASRHGNRLRGEVIHIDHFGNIRTSVTATDLQLGPGVTVRAIELRNRRIEFFARYYTEQAVGGLLGLIDSDGYLEIAANQGNAAHELGCCLGDVVVVELAGFPALGGEH